MSLTVVVIVNAVLAVALFAVLASVMRIPFRLDRAVAETVPQPSEALLDDRLAA